MFVWAAVSSLAQFNNNNQQVEVYMAYILKDAQGNVIAASVSENPSVPENLGADWIFIEDDAREYLEFLESSLAKADIFRESDIHLARVLEDLITLLIERHIIRFTDLPQAAQKRLNDRQSMRNKSRAPSILDDSADIFLDS